MSNSNPLRMKSANFLRNNNVTVMFVFLCVAAFFISGSSLSFLLPELFTRIGRNTFMILSLIIPVVAGLGLNFGIVIGAASAQIAIFLVVLWDIQGLLGILVCVAISTPLAIIFGYFIGRLFNNMKGAEMVGGLVAGYFSDGLYQLLFLFVLGGIIPINNNKLMIPTGVGVRNSISLESTIKYALDEVLLVNILEVAFYVVVAISIIQIIVALVKKKPGIKALLIRIAIATAIYAITFIDIPYINKILYSRRLLLLNAIDISLVGVIIYNIVQLIRKKVTKTLEKSDIIKHIAGIAIMAGIYLLTFIEPVYKACLATKLPVLTYMCVGGMCLLIPWFMNTKLGQEMRTVGHNREVAASAGINVDRTRIIAMIISTVLASYGQIISLQNIGTVATYGAHQQVGLYAIAALLVGGASVQKASVKQALLGVVLFHTLFILAPNAGKVLTGDSQIGEYFRVFVAYGVIALSLAMHAWSAKKTKDTRNKQKASTGATKA